MSVGQVSCKECRRKWIGLNPEKYLEIQRISSKKYYEKNKDEIMKKQKERRRRNKEGAACEIVKKHHEDMKEDPERLTTEFIKNILHVKCEDYDV